MRKKISALIVDPEYVKHDYSEVKTNYGGYCEKYFELKIVDSGKNILEDINNFKNFDCMLTIGDKTQWEYLNKLPYFYRKKWIHLESFSQDLITKAILGCFVGNINRENETKLFSIFTCTYNTGQEKLDRLYNSLLSQTYNNWNWFILDDSTNDETIQILNNYKDPRITILKNPKNVGVIGYNKHVIAMACDGDYLVEVDHDDELTSDCLFYLNKAFETYPDSDFAYSRALELSGKNKIPIIYGDYWGWGEGETAVELIENKWYTYSESPAVNPYSIRTIYAQPNHVRCWKKEFYHKIGGHNVELSVLDDMDILIRTFLYGKMTKINKCLYIQYEGEGVRGVNEENTQSQRFGEIQRTCILLKEKYDKQVHDRVLELGAIDDPWDEENGYSYLDKPHIKGQNILCNVLDI